MSNLIRRPWTSEDNNKLIKLWWNFGSIVLIAMSLNRSSSSVQTRASRLGLPRRVEANENHRRKWTEEDNKLFDEAFDNFVGADGLIPIIEISNHIGRSIDAVAAKISELIGGEEELFKRIKINADEQINKLFDAEPAKEEKKSDEQKNVDTRKIAKERNCMCCGSKFWSEHAGNRMCAKCRSGDIDYDW